MPRKNPLPALEAEICRRLAKFRKASGLSRVAFAQRAGCDSTTISNLEHFRAPLRYSVGKKLSNNLWLNPDWLVRGGGYPIWEGKIGGPYESALREADLFSEVYLENFKGAEEERYAGHLAWSEEVKDWLGTMGIKANFEKVSPAEYKESQRRLLERPAIKSILEDRDQMIIQIAFGQKIQSPSAFLKLAEKRKK